MAEQRKDYHIALVGYEPDHNIPNTTQQARIYFKKDTLHFPTRQEQMEFVDNHERIAEAVRNSDVLKLILAKYAKSRTVSPIIELMLYFQGESGGRIYFDESREVDVGLGRMMKRTSENKHEVISHRSDIALMPELFKK